MSIPIRSLRSTSVARSALFTSVRIAAAPSPRLLVSPAPIRTSPPPTCNGRLFSTSLQSQRQSKDKSWVQKGPVPYPELKAHTETPDGSTLLIDVREPNETSEGMIPSAVNVPLTDFAQAFLNKEGGGDFLKKYAFPKPQFDQKIIVYCRSGKRSEVARQELEKAGWWNVRNYTGSWLDWTSQEKARGNNDD